MANSGKFPKQFALIVDSNPENDMEKFCKRNKSMDGVNPFLSEETNQKEQSSAAEDAIEKDNNGIEFEEKELEMDCIEVFNPWPRIEKIIEENQSILKDVVNNPWPRIEKNIEENQSILKDEVVNPWSRIKKIIAENQSILQDKAFFSERSQVGKKTSTDLLVSSSDDDFIKYEDMRKEEDGELFDLKFSPISNAEKSLEILPTFIESTESLVNVYIDQNSPMNTSLQKKTTMASGELQENEYHAKLDSNKTMMMGDNIRSFKEDTSEEDLPEYEEEDASSILSGNYLSDNEIYLSDRQCKRKKKNNFPRRFHSSHFFKKIKADAVPPKRDPTCKRRHPAQKLKEDNALEKCKSFLGPYKKSDVKKNFYKNCAAKKEKKLQTPYEMKLLEQSPETSKMKLNQNASKKCRLEEEMEFSEISQDKSMHQREYNVSNKNLMSMYENALRELKEVDSKNRDLWAQMTQLDMQRDIKRISSEKEANNNLMINAHLDLAKNLNKVLIHEIAEFDKRDEIVQSERSNYLKKKIDSSNIKYANIMRTIGDIAEVSQPSNHKLEHPIGCNLDRNCEPRYDAERSSSQPYFQQKNENKESPQGHYEGCKTNIDAYSHQNNQNCERQCLSHDLEKKSAEKIEKDSKYGSNDSLCQNIPNELAFKKQGRRRSRAKRFNAKRRGKHVNNYEQDGQHLSCLDSDPKVREYRQLLNLVRPMHNGQSLLDSQDLDNDSEFWFGQNARFFMTLLLMLALFLALFFVS